MDVIYTPEQEQAMRDQDEMNVFQLLAKEDPDAIIVDLPPIQAIISSKYGDEFHYGYTSAWDFLKWRITSLDNDLNRLLTECGFDSDDGAEFILNLTDTDNLEDFILDNYDAHCIKEEF